MRDPKAVFLESPGKHNTLKMLWPELYEALAPPPDETKQAPPCSSGRHHFGQERPRAVARLSPGGAPACAACVQAIAVRPGGFPLDDRFQR